jgi:hypothetical protein
MIDDAEVCNFFLNERATLFSCLQDPAYLRGFPNRL